MKWISCFDCKHLEWSHRRFSWVCRKKKKPNNEVFIYDYKDCENYEGGD